MRARMPASGWSTRERRSPAGVVDSIQRVVLARELVSATSDGALELGARYWVELEQSSRGLVRVRTAGHEPSVVLAGRLPLFRFGAARLRLEDGLVECGYTILGGALVARAGGCLSIAQRSGDVVELELAVTDYLPRLSDGRLGPLRRLVYAAVQRPLHAAVSRRFLARAARSVS